MIDQFEEWDKSVWILQDECEKTIAIFDRKPTVDALRAALPDNVKNLDELLDKSCLIYDECGQDYYLIAHELVEVRT